MNFQIKQCEIKIEYLFFAVIAFLLFTDTTGVALLGIAATVLHEAGHLVMMLLLGSSVKTVRFHAFGVDIEETGRDDAVIYQMHWLPWPVPLPI